VETPLQHLLERELDRRGLLRLGAAAAVGSSFLSACGGSDSAGTPADAGATGASDVTRGGVVLVSYSAASSTDKLDPARAVTGLEACIGGMLYDNLVRTDLQFNIQPGLATSWDVTPDAKTWTFQLRDGVEFHNGQPLTSQDVVFSIARILDPDVGSGGAVNLAPVLDADGIKADGPSTVVFELKAPHAFLPAILAAYTQRIIPDGETEFKGNGTGPFTIKSFEAGAGFEVARNPNYWEEGKPYLDGVRVAVVLEQATKVQSVVAGDADLADTIEYSAIPTVQQASSLELYPAPGGVFLPLVAAANNEPFAHEGVRQALKLAVDRQRMVDVVYHGQATVSADVTVPPNDAFYPSIDPFPYDPAEARSLLKQAGYSNGVDVTLYTSQAYPGIVDTAVAYKEMAAEAGINVDVQVWPAASYWDKVWLKKPFMVSSWLRQHVSVILQQVYSQESPWYESQFADPQFEDLIVQAQGSTDEAEQKELYGQAMQLANDKSGEIVPCHAAKVWVGKDKVKGLKLDISNDANFHEVYIA
jgi:peptide/nickel transport system substrate-binding protein